VFKNRPVRFVSPKPKVKHYGTKKEPERESEKEEHGEGRGWRDSSIGGVLRM